MQTEFVQGTNRPLLDTLNIPHGYLTIDDGVIITSLDQGRALLQHHVDKHGLDPDDAMDTDEAMVDTNLLPDDAAVMAVIKAYELPADYTDEGKFTFQVHNDCAGNPLPHGHVFYPDDGPPFQQYSTTDTALIDLTRAVDKGRVRPSNGINLLQQMHMSGLPLNDKDHDRLYRELSADVVQAHQEVVLSQMMEGAQETPPVVTPIGDPNALHEIDMLVSLLALLTTLDTGRFQGGMQVIDIDVEQD